MIAQITTMNMVTKLATVVKDYLELFIMMSMVIRLAYRMTVSWITKITMIAWVSECMK